jgi:transcriptional regulator with XRE-family HTH domain
MTITCAYWRPGEPSSPCPYPSLGSLPVNLQQLIESRRGAEPLRLSLQDLSNKSGMSKATWQTYAVQRPTGGRRVPERRTIHALARGLGVDTDVVWRAIGESMRVLDPDPERPALLDALPPRDVLARLDGAQVQTVVQLILLLADTPSPARTRSRRRVQAQRAVAAPQSSMATA